LTIALFEDEIIVIGAVVAGAEFSVGLSLFERFLLYLPDIGQSKLGEGLRKDLEHEGSLESGGQRFLF
jgi:hypothetical protein